MDSTRTTDLRMGVRIEVITILWMVVEMAVSIGAGIAARSVLLTAFGVDSLIELVSGSILLWRLSTENRGGDLGSVRRAERRAAWVVAVSLSLLCAYVLISSVYLLLTHAKPDSSLIGIGVSAAALLIMPWLAVSKRRISKRIHSAALAGDSANSMTCAVHGRDRIGRSGREFAIRIMVGRVRCRAGVPGLAGSGNPGGVC